MDDLLVRATEAYDGVEPSGNSAAARLFLGLAAYGVETFENRTKAEQILKYFKPEIEDHPSQHTSLLQALRLCLCPDPAIVLAKGDNPAEYQAIFDWARQSGFPFVPASEHIPLAQNRPAIDGKTTVYVCRDLACELPVHTLQETKNLIAKIRRRP